MDILFIATSAAAIIVVTASIAAGTLFAGGFIAKKFSQ